MNRRSVIKLGMLAGASSLIPFSAKAIHVISLPGEVHHGRHGYFNLHGPESHAKLGVNNVRLDRFYANGISSSKEDLILLTFQFNGTPQFFQFTEAAIGLEFPLLKKVRINNESQYFLICK